MNLSPANKNLFTTSFMLYLDIPFDIPCYTFIPCYTCDTFDKSQFYIVTPTAHFDKSIILLLLVFLFFVLINPIIFDISIDSLF